MVAGRDAHLSSVVDALATLGARRGYSYPWHQTDDPFRVLLAEYLLRRTTRTVVARVYEKVVARYPNAAALAEAGEEELWEVSREVGLRRRTLQLIGIARRVKREGRVEPSRKSLLDMPYVGPYIADAVLLYAFGERVFPVDNNVQRVLYRVVRGEHPPRRVDPHKDCNVEQMVDALTRGQDPLVLRDAHQGLMIVAWEVCRSRPICRACVLNEVCLYAKRPT